MFFKKEPVEQELYCHDCGNYLRFKTKPEKSGNLTIVCDFCGHQHCRVVKNGIITSDRWGNKNGHSPVDKSLGVMANSHKKSLWEEQNG